MSQFTNILKGLMTKLERQEAAVKETKEHIAAIQALEKIENKK